VPIAVSLSAARTVYAGGLTGRAWDTKFKNNYAEGSVTISGAGNANAGGFAGAFADSETLNTEPNYATGAVTVSGTGELRVGGFAGSVTALEPGRAATVINHCHATGDVKIISGTTTGFYWVGGFTGESRRNVQMSNSWAEGHVTVGTSSVPLDGTANINAAGGFAGIIDGTGGDNNPYADYVNLGAKGNVTVYNETLGNIPKEKAIGGFVGLVERCATLKRVYSTGNVEMHNTVSTHCDAGGIAGEQRNSDIIESYSTGTVKNYNDSGNVYAGGISGYLSYGNKITDCYSLGDITASGTSSGLARAGGILGTVNTQSIEIWHSYAAGLILANGSGSANVRAGGIAAYLLSTQDVTFLESNVYLGTSITAGGTTDAKIARFIYAEGPGANTSKPNYYLSDATRDPNTYLDSRPFDGGVPGSVAGAKPATDFNLSSAVNTWNNVLGYTNSAWKDAIDDFNTIRPSIYAPKLKENSTLPW
jgi:hypothetical protein